PRLCAVGATGREKLTKSFRKRVTHIGARWLGRQNGAAEEEERTGEQVIHARADSARGDRYGSRIRRDHRWRAGKTGGQLRQPAQDHSREDDAPQRPVISSAHRRGSLL